MYVIYLTYIKKSGKFRIFHFLSLTWTIISPNGRPATLIIASVIECSGWVEAGDGTHIDVVVFVVVAVGDEEPDPCELLVTAVLADSVMAAGCGGVLNMLSRCCCWSAAIGLWPNSPSGRTRYCWTPITWGYNVL